MPSGCGCGSRQRERAHAQPQPLGGLQQATQAKPSQQQRADKTSHTSCFCGSETQRLPNESVALLALFIYKNKRDEETRIEWVAWRQQQQQHHRFFYTFFLNEYWNYYFTQKCFRLKVHETIADDRKRDWEKRKSSREAKEKQNATIVKRIAGWESRDARDAGL